MKYRKNNYLIGKMSQLTKKECSRNTVCGNWFWLTYHRVIMIKLKKSRECAESVVCENRFDCFLSININD